MPNINKQLLKWYLGEQGHKNIYRHIATMLTVAQSRELRVALANAIREAKDADRR